MKRIQYFIAFSLVLLCADFYAHEPLRKRSYSAMSAPETVSVEAYFVPRDSAQLQRKLSSLVNNANKQILIAMYWVKENFFLINELIAAQKRGVDVQIVFDESVGGDSNKSEDRVKHVAFIKLLNTLLSHNILPIIYPSIYTKDRSFVGNIMHNKFLVIDDSIVCTGSANFTRPAFSPVSQCFNYENMVIINSETIADKYQLYFHNIKEQAFNLYIKIIASIDQEQLPEWVKKLKIKLYRTKQLDQAIYVLWNQLNKDHHERLKSFFNWRGPTIRQQQYADHLGIVLTEEMPGWYVYKLIDSAKQQKAIIKRQSKK